MHRACESSHSIATVEFVQCAPPHREQHMEILLLLLDDLDDLLHALRMALPRLAGFGVALTLFAALVISAMTWPWTMFAAVTSAALVLVVRSNTRIAPFLGLKTDP